MSRWDLARARSQQPARKYKVCGPVGDPANNAPVPWSVQRIREGFGQPPPPVAEERPLCRFCGLTDCEYAPPLEPTRSTIKARIDTLERFRELGMLDTPGQREAVFRALLDGDYSGFGVKP
jgi:hypothetical protein